MLLNVENTILKMLTKLRSIFVLRAKPAVILCILLPLQITFIQEMNR